MFDEPSERNAGASPTQGIVTRQLQGFEELSAAVAPWKGEFQQMSRGLFQGTVQVVTGRHLRLFQVDINQSILTRGMNDAACMTFTPVTSENEASVWQGRRLSAGQMLVKGPDVAYHNQTNRNARVQGLLVPVQTFREAVRILNQHEAEGLIKTWSAFRPCPQRLQRFKRALNAMVRRATVAPRLFASSDGQVFEAACLRALIETVCDPATEGARRLSLTTRLALVKRAVAMMDAHLDQPITALQLCAEIGVSDRTLRRAFRDQYGLGPLAYSRLMRLHAVRAALREARGRDRAVGEVLRQFGFNRQGAFASEYRNQFGEHPSETLGVRGWPGIQQMTRATE